MTGAEDRLDFGRAGRWSRRRRWTTVLIGVAVLACLGAAGWYGSRPNEKERAAAACKVWEDRVGEQRDVLLEISDSKETLTLDPSWKRDDRTNPRLLRDHLADPERSFITLARWPSTAEDLREALGSHGNDTGADDDVADLVDEVTSLLGAVLVHAEADEVQALMAPSFDALSLLAQTDTVCDRLLGNDR